MPIKPSSRRIELNKTNDSLRPSTCMQSKTIRIMMQPPRIPMWLHSDHNLHSNSNSANNRATTMEIDQGDKDPTEATISTTDYRRTKASMLPEMVNSVSTARSLITPMKNVTKELMTKSLVLQQRTNLLAKNQ
jgi:hypothetical protein